MKHRRTVTLALVSSLAVAGFASAEDKKPAAGMEMPKPGPEVKRLGYFVGGWKLEAEMKPGPMGSGGKVTGTSNCSWFDGNFAVVCRDTAQTPIGAMKGMGVLSWDREDKKYAYYGVDSTGMTERAEGTVENDTWVYTNDGKMNGKPFKGRYTISNVKPDSYDFKWETSEDGNTWATAMEGKYRRAGGAKKPAPAKKG